MKERIRWGILGPGAVSRLFAEGLRDAEGAELAAVGSRDNGRAERFASEYGAARAYGSYEELAGDDDVDAVYIGTPHSFHRDHTILCLRAGRSVLCEKPLAIDAREASEMIATAADLEGAGAGSGPALMEAMWTRFLPAMVRVRELVSAGALGEIRLVRADFGFLADFDPAGRLFDPALGGGALLDVGVYPVSLAHMVLGVPEAVGSRVAIGETGVDEESVAVLWYPDGAKARLTMSIRRDTSREALIMGTEGTIMIPAPWWRPQRFVLAGVDGGEEEFELPYRGNGYTHEAEEFMDMIREGRRESGAMPLSESLAVMETLDWIRSSWKAGYPAKG